MYSNPLRRLLRRGRIDVASYCDWQSTACYRCYCGTWEVVGDQLRLVHFNLDGGAKGETPIPDALRARLLRVANARAFPIDATWFSGHLRVLTGPRLVYSHHGWSSWHESELVLSVVKGRVVRRRTVDGAAILKWWLARNERLCALLEGRRLADHAVPPLVWRDENDDPPPFDDWWPPDYPRRAT